MAQLRGVEDAAPYNCRHTGAREGCSLPLTARAEQSPAPTHIPFPPRGFGGTPDSKVEEGPLALSANSNTAFA